MTSTPKPVKIKTFRTEAAFESWMRKNHANASEVWLRIYKKNSGVPSITIAQALDVVLCWGWIDGLRKGFDEQSYLQRYTPRRAKSLWSQINRKHVARLTKAGRMTPHGQRQVEAADLGVLHRQLVKDAVVRLDGRQAARIGTIWSWSPARVNASAPSWTALNFARNGAGLAWRSTTSAPRR